MNDIDNIHDKVRDDYKQILVEPGNSVLSVSTADSSVAEAVGYSLEELASVPEEANRGLGCGNPVRTAELKEGEVVLDLGCGAGLDCFLAATKVGRRGRAVGVDMTPEMLVEARSIAKKHRIRNVEFRLGEIENLPAADNFADVCISNCVINLSPDKARVYREIFRILKPGGRISICDIIIKKSLPDDIKNDADMYSC